MSRHFPRASPRIYAGSVTPEEIVAKFDHPTLAQIHAALAYYHANREEINGDLADEEAAVPAGASPSPSSPVGVRIET